MMRGGRGALLPLLALGMATTNTSADTVRTVLTALPSTRPISWQENTHIPDIARRPLNGVAFAGGGNRAFTAATGTLRGLHHLQLLDDIKYVTGVSGSSWAVGMLAFSPHDTDTLLGPHVDPSDLTLSALSAAPPAGTLAALVPSLKAYAAHVGQDAFLEWAVSSHANLTGLIDYFRSHPPQPDAVWIDGIAELYYRRVDLPPDAYFSWNATTWADIVSRQDTATSALDHVNVTFVRPSFPYPILSSMVMGPADMAPLKANTEWNQWRPFEFTPLYAGVPYKSSAYTYKNSTASQTIRVGGLIEPFAFGTSPVGDVLSANETTAVCDMSALPHHPLSIARASAICSMALCTTFGHQPGAGLFDGVPVWDAVPRHNVFDVTDADSNEEVMLGDGGLLEITGIVSLVRRGVQHVVVMDYTSSPLANDTNLASLFGVWLTGTVGRDSDNSHNHIFEMAAYEPSLAAIEHAIAAGEAPFAHLNLTTVHNSYLDVPAGLAISVMWVFNDAPARWVERLPADTRAEVAAAGNASSPLHNFPRYGTQTQFLLSSTQVNLLSHMHSSMVLDNADAFRIGLGLPAGRVTATPTSTPTPSPSASSGPGAEGGGLSAGVVGGLVAAGGCIALVGAVWAVRRVVRRRDRQRVSTSARTAAGGAKWGLFGGRRRSLSVEAGAQGDNPCVMAPVGEESRAS